MRLTVNGATHEFDVDTITNAEAMQIEKVCGATFKKWNELLADGSALALTALVWIVLRRDAPTLAFDDVAFDLSGLEIANEETEIEAVPTTEPTTTP